MNQQERRVNQSILPERIFAFLLIHYTNEPHTTKSNNNQQHFQENFRNVHSGGARKQTGIPTRHLGMTSCLANQSWK